MGILNRWRQFGRRYFWPHLLLGMVAAGFSMPLLPGGGQEMLHQADSGASLSRQSAFQVGFSQLARLKDVPCRPAYAVDYWHQHAIRTVIRHLSIAWAPAPEAVAHATRAASGAAYHVWPVAKSRSAAAGAGAPAASNGPCRLHRPPQRHPSGPAAENTRRPVCGHLTLKDRNFPANDFLAADGRGRDEM